MDVFDLREHIVREYRDFSRSFTRVRSDDLKAFLERLYDEQHFWPDPLIQINPSFVEGRTIEALVEEGVLHPECASIFRIGKTKDGPGATIRLYRHQDQAIEIAQRGESYVLTTGTGSGKSLSYFVPIVDHVLREKKDSPEPKIRAIVVYPMNALANSQKEELEKFLCRGYPPGRAPVTFGQYTGQEDESERLRMAAHPPDILLTNFMMLELILTRQDDPDKAVIANAAGLKFLVLDELHSYRGRQGADVALLVRRVREALNEDLICVGTSATMASDEAGGDRRQIVAEVASRLFGKPVKPENVVTESLKRVTQGSPEEAIRHLADAIRPGVPENMDLEELARHPVAVWVETRLGLRQEGAGWVRAKPQPLGEAARMLATESGLGQDECASYLRRFLLLAQQKGLFAFRLHQFISGAGAVYATLEPPGVRQIDVSGQQVAPGSREKRLFPVAFCRECGQEYHPVWAHKVGGELARLEPRDLDERTREDDEADFGLFMPDPDGVWDGDNIDAYPEAWLDLSTDPPRLKSHYRKYRPRPIEVDVQGRIGNGLKGWFMPGSLRFCLNPECTATYTTHSRESARLSGLSSEGRSSATTVLTLSTLRYMRSHAVGLDSSARKLLAFTDNRQDAALQAGHFNDFLQVLLLRAALLASVRARQAGGGLHSRDVAQAVLEMLGFDRDDPGVRREFMSNPDVRGLAARRAVEALRDVLGYRVYHDLRRGWRLIHPNLEQLELVRIEYEGLDDLAADQALWEDLHPLLAAAEPERRREILRELLDTMRRGLCIKTMYLDRGHLDRIIQASQAHLKEPWGFTEDETLQTLDTARFLVPGPRGRNDDPLREPLSVRSVFGKLVRLPSTWGDAAGLLPTRPNEEWFRTLLDALLEGAVAHGLVERVGFDRDLDGYQVVGDVLQWRLGDVDLDDKPVGGPYRNPYFRRLYLEVAERLADGRRDLFQLRAAEHTAQVDPDDRKEREEKFRSADLPLLVCSPTMELGVDISDLNVVYLRNVPPTPANYAQRSGRAGRSGQAALVLTYCAARSPHDQYFFQDPARMVQGEVRPPSLDLANEELLRSHVHAIWLKETGAKLDSSIAQILDLQDISSLPVRADLTDQLDADRARERAMRRCGRVLAMLTDELTPEAAPWYHERWLDHVVRSAFRNLDQAFDRWRGLYRASRRQMDEAHGVLINAGASQRERDDANLRYREAKVQQDLLLQGLPTMNSDFYSYRYLASQGFLPGYNFPRLPLMAFIPARREKIARETFLSRPRFLAISEFGPLAAIYHEGSRYRVRKVMIGVRDEEGADSSRGLPVRRARLCPACGYGHFGESSEDERCHACGAPLEGGLRLGNLYRVENVAARRTTRITSDEEDRLRQGYEMQTTLQYARSDGALQVVRTDYIEGDERLLQVQYGPSATVWRINLGWRRRREKSIYGFNIDVATGVWCRDSDAPEDEDGEAEEGKGRTQKIVPFVEDRRNVLVASPAVELDAEDMATLQYALKRAIETVFQLEESELMAEPLPGRDTRNAILFYEAAEGGAGVLTRLANEPAAMRRVAAAALEICHYRRRGDRWEPAALEDTAADACEQACYRCLLSYYNQPDHPLLDRRREAVVSLLCRLTRAEAERGTEGRDPEEHFQELMRLSGSSLERAWLEAVRASCYRLPDRAQVLIEEFSTRPDFVYTDTQALVYIDGPHHERERRKALDAAKTQELEDAGFLVIRFPADRDRWPGIFREHPDVFGVGCDG